MGLSGSWGVGLVLLFYLSVSDNLCVVISSLLQEDYALNRATSPRRETLLGRGRPEGATYTSTGCRRGSVGALCRTTHKHQALKGWHITSAETNIRARTLRGL
jgi:hypothetical protein